MNGDFATYQWMVRVEEKLDRILADLDHLHRHVEVVMADLTKIQTEVSENTSAVASAVALLDNLAQLIRDNATDVAALNELADQLDANSNQLAEAVVRNTPAEPPPAPEPTPPV